MRKRILFDLGSLRAAEERHEKEIFKLQEQVEMLTRVLKVLINDSRAKLAMEEIEMFAARCIEQS